MRNFKQVRLLSAGSMVVMVPCQLCVVRVMVTVTGCLGHCTPGDINCYLTGPEGGGEGTVVGGSGWSQF